MAGPASSGPSTSQELRPGMAALKPRAMTPAVMHRMVFEGKISRHEELHDEFFHDANVALNKLDNVVDIVLRPDRAMIPELENIDADLAMDEMAKQFESLQASAFILQSLHGAQTHLAFKTVEKVKPPEVKEDLVKKVKQSKKEKKEQAIAAAKAERNHKEKAAPAPPKTPQRVSVDENNEAPVAINRGKRRAAAAVAVAAVSATTAAEKTEKTEKRPRKESSAKKRTSTRLSKTPRVNTKEEEEPTYCFCSRVSFGEMVGCDNDKCEIEWFHFECIGLTTKPKGKWFCPNCRHPDSARMPKTAKSVKKEKD